MSVREPKGKSQQTKTARIVGAMAQDVENYLRALKQIAEAYQNGDTHCYHGIPLAVAVDDVFDHLRCLYNGWPKR